MFVLDQSINVIKFMKGLYTYTSGYIIRLQMVTQA